MSIWRLRSQMSPTQPITKASGAMPSVRRAAARSSGAITGKREVSMKLGIMRIAERRTRLTVT